MSSTLAVLDLYNIALGHISERAMTAVDENSANARWFETNYVAIRDGFLRANPWNFTITYAADVAEDATAPAFRWLHRYAIPSGCLRVLPLTYDGDRGGQLIAYEIVRGFIHTNLTSPINIRYIARVTTITEFDPLAVEALALLLAARLSTTRVGKYELRDRLEQNFKDAVRLARETDAIEDTAEPIEAHDIIRVRG